MTSAILVQTLRIFISSPGDVQPERLYAERLIKRLANEFSDRVALDAYSDLSPHPEDRTDGPASFLLVSAMSGAGKSFLIRAGVLPLFFKGGVIEGVNLWRHAIFRPSDAVGDLLDGLAQALIGPESLPELAAGGVSVSDLAAEIRKEPGGLDLPIAQALFHAPDIVRKDQEASLGKQLDDHRKRGRVNDANRIVQELKDLTPGNAHLLLIVDQLEEIFTVPKINEAPDIRSRFMSLQLRDCSMRLLSRTVSKSAWMKSFETPPWMTQPRYRSLSSASTIAKLSQDGKRLVIGSDDHTAQIWNTQTWQPLTPLLPHDSNVVLAQFGADGKRLLCLVRFNCSGLGLRDRSDVH